METVQVEQNATASSRVEVSRPAASTVELCWGTLIAVRDATLGSMEAERWTQALSKLAVSGARILVVHPGKPLEGEERLADQLRSFPLLWKRVRGRVKRGITTRFLRSLARIHGAEAFVVPSLTDKTTRRAARKQRLACIDCDQAISNTGSIKRDIQARQEQRRIKGRAIRVAFMGTRGVPASYSGFETFVHELGTRLAAQDGFEVTVYNRRHHCGDVGESYNGMKVVMQRGLRSKHFDTISHTALSILHSLRARHDVIILCGVGNAAYAPFLRMLKSRLIFNVDGSDWKRGKWGTAAKLYLKNCEKIAARAGDIVIADSKAVREHYEETWGMAAPYIAYGGGLTPTTDKSVLEEFGLEPGRYVLFVGRLVPENGAHRLIDAFMRLDTDMKLAIVGDAPYSEEYKQELRDMADDRVVFTGYQFAEAYLQFSSHAYLYVLACNVGGTHPVLVEQMSVGNAIIVHETQSNAEVIGDAGFVYSGPGEGVQALSDAMQRFIDHPEVVEELGERAQQRAREHYSWEAVTKDYSRLIESLVGGAAKLPSDQGVDVNE